MSDQAYQAFEAWHNANSYAARTEGWDIWDCDGSANGRFQLCKDDVGDLLPDDETAWRLVRDRANEGSALHVSALAFLAEHNAQEHRLVMSA